MSISPISSLLSSAPSASAAVGTQNALLHTTVGERTIKDRIDLSKDALTLLGGAAPAAS